jgi:hypothetical protein
MKKLFKTPYPYALLAMSLALFAFVGNIYLDNNKQPEANPEIVSLDFAGIVDAGDGTGQALLLSVDEMGIGTRNVPLSEKRSVFVASGIVQVTYSDGTVKSLEVPTFDIVVEGNSVVFYLPFATVTCGQENCEINSLNFAFATPIPLAPKAP